MNINSLTNSLQIISIINVVPYTIFNGLQSIITTKGIASRPLYQTLLPDDIIEYIFINFLPLEDQCSKRFALVSYQFYVISKASRDRLNKDIEVIFNQINKEIGNSYNSFYKSCKLGCTKAIFGFLIDFNYTNKGILTRVNCTITRDVLKYDKKFDENGSVDTDMIISEYVSENELTNKKIIFIDTFEVKNYLGYKGKSCSLKHHLKTFASSDLNPELQLIGPRVETKINCDRMDIFELFLSSCKKEFS